MYGENFHFIFIHKTKAPLSDFALPPPTSRLLESFRGLLYLHLWRTEAHPFLSRENGKESTDADDVKEFLFQKK